METRSIKFLLTPKQIVSVLLLIEWENSKKSILPGLTRGRLTPHVYVGLSEKVFET